MGSQSIALKNSPANSLAKSSQIALTMTLSEMGNTAKKRYVIKILVNSQMTQPIRGKFSERFKINQNFFPLFVTPGWTVLFRSVGRDKLQLLCFGIDFIYYGFLAR